MDTITFLILALATFRLSLLFTEEEGPYGIFTRLRELVGVRQVEYPNGTVIFEKGNDTLLAGIFSCLWCFSIWAGAIVYIIYLLLPIIALPVFTILAISSVTIFLNRYSN